MPDHHPTLLSLTIALGVLALGFGLIERFFPAIRGTSIWRRDRLADFAYWFFTPFVTRTMGALSILITIVLLSLIIRRPLSGGLAAPWVGAQPIAAQIAEVLIASDLLGYWSHRLFHRRPLWRFHAVHHSSTMLDWLSAARVHPVNEIVGRILQIGPLYLLGFDPRVLAGAVPFFTLYAIFIHANVRWGFGPLGYLVASPRFHRWHHTSEKQGLDRNFAGLFPWIDLLFGTLYLPRGENPRHFGLAGEPLPSGFLAQLAWPFSKHGQES